MQSGPVIESFDVVEDGGASFCPCGKAVVIDQFIFKAAPEGLDECVIITVAFAAHGSEQAMPCQHLPVGRTRELTAAIGVKNKLAGGPTLTQCHAKGGNDKRGIKNGTHCPADDPPRADIEHRYQI